jgi:hypothetical protein
MRKIYWLLVFLLFLGVYFQTAPHYIGDTTRYVEDAVGHAQGRDTAFWEFGHLLWRPWAYAGYRMFGEAYGRWFGDGPEQAAARFLIQTNLVCSCAAVLLALYLLRKAAPPWAAAVVALAMGCSAPFLDYSHSGAPYIPALLFSTLSLCLLVAAAEHLNDGLRYALMAGVSFAVACALWFPFSFTGLGMALVTCVWPSRDAEAEKNGRALRLGAAGAFLLALAGSTVILFAAGAAAKGIGNGRELVQWVQESGNGWSQSRTVVRAVSGVARSVWDFGEDAVLLKRWLFSDPYNPVMIRGVALSMGWKLGLFYLGMGASIWALWKDRRRLLFLLAAAGVPLLLFAVLVFEPSSPERFLPAFPFVFLGFAVVLAGSHRRRIASACVATLLGSFVVFNLAQFRSTRAADRMAETKARMSALTSQVRPGALVFLVTFQDDLYRLPPLNPLDRSLEHPLFSVTDTVEVASQRSLRWRSEFAERAMAQWSQQKEAWLSERLLAARPEAGWLWVEGDSGRICWREFHETFGQFEFDSQVMAGRDGFRRLTQNAANAQLLASLIAAPQAE